MTYNEELKLFWAGWMAAFEWHFDPRQHLAQDQAIVNAFEKHRREKNDE